MSRASRIRQELRETEAKANFYFREYLASTNETWWLTMWNMYAHYMGRRRFFLRDLLKVQLKEFDHEN